MRTAALVLVLAFAFAVPAAAVTVKLCGGDVTAHTPQPDLCSKLSPGARFNKAFKVHGGAYKIAPDDKCYSIVKACSYTGFKSLDLKQKEEKKDFNGCTVLNISAQNGYPYRWLVYEASTKTWALVRTSRDDALSMQCLFGDDE